MKISFYTLGCKANQAETAAMERLAAGAGHESVPFGSPAELTVINTCTVTATADAKSRRAMRQARAASPEGIVAVCGCYGQKSARRLVESGLCDVACGNRDHRAFLEAALQAVHTRRPFFHTDTQAEFRLLPAAIPEGRTRALLKVQDGCENRCAYCIIPQMRGAVRCISPEDAEREARRAAHELGAAELVLTGIEVAAYRHGDTDFTALVDRICRAVPNVRIRLGSLEPRVVDERFCALAAHGNLCPHFHLSLQSGCDATLARMRRRYNTARYARAIADLREAFPDASFTTDLICGFPGETGEEFEQSLAFAKTCRFLKVHVFPFSVREGTEAASLEGQVARSVKEQRCRAASVALGGISRELLQTFVGRRLSVLCERSPAPGRMRGYSPGYVPVEFDGEPSLSNTLVEVDILGIQGEGLVGKRV